MWDELRTRINAWIFFLCFILAFAACSLAGRDCAQHNQFVNFRRFHKLLNAETYFYPTVSQMVSLAEESLREGKKVVIVGGNSVAMGKGQGADLWTEKLQHKLGSEYKVLNMAQSLMPPLSGPYLAFLSLHQRYPDIFYVCVSEYCVVNQLEDAYQHYPYWWDAYYKKLLPSLPDIDEKIDSRTHFGTERETFEEEKLGSFLDSIFYFRDLWTTIGYKYFFTVWTPGTADVFLSARKDLPDTDPPVIKEVPARFINFNSEIDRPRLLTRFNYIFKEESPQHWQLNSDTIDLARSNMNAMIPFRNRDHMLQIGVKDCPYYVRQVLSKSEQAQLDETGELSTQMWQGLGCHSLNVGRDFIDEDYIDDCHLSASGGVKLADLVAAELKTMSGAKK